MMKNYKFHLLGAASVLIASLPLSANAEDKVAVASANDGDIVVTAQRRSESLQRVPVAVTALNTAALEQRAASRLEDVSASTPSLTVSTTTASPSSIMIAMRGAMQQSGGSITAESPVAIYIDDVYQPRLQAGNYDLADIQRVEVLRGPQGTLYGRNSMTGAVKLITRQADGDTWFNTDLSYASFEEVKVKASIGAPITDNLAIAASAFYNDRNKGYQYNETLDKRVGTFTRYGAQVSLGVTNIENFEASLMYRYVANLSDGQYFQPVSTTGQNLADGHYNTRTPRDADGDNKQHSAALTLGYDFGSAKLRSITAYQKMDDEWSTDFSGGFPRDGEYITGYFRSTDSRQEQVSQEFQLLGESADDRLNWILGAFYFKETGNQIYHRDELLAYYSISEPAAFDIGSESVAFYGQGDYKITDKLTGSIGIRFSKDNKDFEGLAPRAGGLGQPLFESQYKLKSNVWTPRFNLQYQITPDAMVYGTISRGYKAGSFNTLLVNNIGFGSPYDPEFAWSYEVGAKLQMFDRKVYVNLAAYNSIFNDLQVTTTRDDGASEVINTAKAKVYGLEWEVGVRPIDGLNLYSSGAYTNNKYLELDDRAATALNNAEKLAMISRWQAQFGGNYEFQLGNAGSLSLAANYDYRSPYFVQVSLHPISRIDDLNRVNGSITYKTPSEKAEIYLQGSNLTKSEDWATSMNFMPGAFATRYAANPRIIRLGFRYKY